MGELVAKTSNKKTQASQGEIILGSHRDGLLLSAPIAEDLKPRFYRAFLTAINSNKGLQECDRASLLGALYQCASLGLEPNTFGQAYIVPYKSKDNPTPKAQFQLGYKGYLEIVRRSNEISSVYAEAVYSKDKFIPSLGTKREIQHEYNISEDRGILIAFYAVAIYKKGGCDFTIMSRSEIDKIRSSSPSSNSPSWRNFYEEMGKKVCLKRLCKTLPMSLDDQRRLDSDERVISIPSQEIKGEETEVIIEREIEIEEEKGEENV